MANNIYATPAQANIQPMDFSMYMQSQEMMAKATQAQQATQGAMLDRQATQLGQGIESVQGTISTLDSMQAYGEEDERRLDEIKSGYMQRIKGLITQGTEGGGLHTIANPLQLESFKLNRDITQGELQGIGTRYAKSQNNLEELDKLRTQGKMEDYDYYWHRKNLLTPPAPSVDITEEIAKYVTSAGTKGKTLEEIQAEVVNLAQNMYAPQMGRMIQYDEELNGTSYERQINSLLSMAMLKDSEGGGGVFSTSRPGLNSAAAANGGMPTAMYETGAGNVGASRWRWFIGDYKDAINRTANNVFIDDKYLSADYDIKKQAMDVADKRAAATSYGFTAFNSNKEANEAKGAVLRSIAGLGIKSLDRDNSIDSAELKSEIFDKEKYDQNSFTVNGYYIRSPHFPAGLHAKIKNLETNEFEEFIIENPNPSSGDRMMFDLYAPFYNAEDRAEGKAYTVDIRLSDNDKEEPDHEFFSKWVIRDDAGIPTWQPIVQIRNKKTGNIVKVPNLPETMTAYQGVEFIEDLTNRITQ